MKTISVLIPTFNEQENVIPMCQSIMAVFARDLPGYQYEIVFIDNDSHDNTQGYLTELCRQHANVRAIFNTRNFGFLNSQFYGLCQTTGDCTVVLCADFQEPPEMIPVFVRAWEEGYKIVAGIKTSSRENKLMYFIRGMYYRLIKKMSNVEQIEHFTGFGLYDKSVVDTMRSLNDPEPFLRGIVAELGYKRKDISYQQQKRRAGKTKHSWLGLYDMAMLSFTSYTKFGLRLATFAGGLLALFGLVIAAYTFIQKLINWDNFQLGTAPILIGVFFFGSVQLFFIGLIGEYIMNINTRIIHRPLVIEKERVNFSRDGIVEKAAAEPAAEK